MKRLLAGAALLCLLVSPASAAEGLDGRSLGLLWAIPFLGMLLSIAIFPLVAHHFWESHRGKISAFWALLAIIPIALQAAVGTAAEAVVHTAFLEYIPFILLLLALFTVAGGIVIRGNIHGAPLTNTVLLAIGAGMASLIGTTGAAMIMIRPVIRANDDRKHNVHVIVFFIFLVANAGGALTPLGDPPLFLGFLKGVDFFWPTIHLLRPMLLICGVLLALFFVLDSYVYAKEGRVRPDPTPDRRISVAGGVNFLLVPVIIAVILLSAWLDLGRVTIYGTEVAVESLARDAAFIVIVLYPWPIRRWATGGKTASAGSPSRRWRSFRRDLHHHHSGAGDAEGRNRRRLRAAGGAGAGAGRPSRQPRLFLDHRRLVLIPRQRADIPGVLRTGGRQSAAVDE